MADLTISVDLKADKAAAGAKKAKEEIKGVGAEAEKLGKSSSVAERDTKKLNEVLAAVGKVATIAGTAILAVGAAILAAAAAGAKAAKIIFDLAKSFAEYVREVDRANQMTGLSVELLSALRTQADLTGRSYDEIGGGIKNFIELIGEANLGKKEATARLERLGIDAKAAAANVEGAFQQAVKRVLELPPGVDQATAAADLFGKELGVKLLPFLKEFGGDLDQAKKEARELGVMLSKEDVAAAREFNRAFAEVQVLLRGVGHTFGREFLPIVRDVLRSVGAWLKENRDDIGRWATAFADGVRGARSALSDFVAWVKENEFWLRVGMAMATVGQSEIYRAGGAIVTEQLINRGRTERQQPPGTLPAPLSGSLSGVPYLSSPDPTGRPRGRAQRPELTDQQKQAQELNRMLKDLNIEIEFFGQKSEEAAMKQQLLRMEIFGTNQGLADQLIKLAIDKDALIAGAEATEKFEEARKKLREAFAAERAGLQAASYNENVGIRAEINKLDDQIRLGRELTAVEERRIDNMAQRLIYERELQLYGYRPDQIAELVSILEHEQEKTLELVEQVQTRRELITLEQQHKALIAGLDSEITDLTIQLQEYTTGLQITRVELLLMSDAYKKLSAEQQAEAVVKAQQIDGLRAAIEQQRRARQEYEDFTNTIRDGLETLADRGFGAFFENVMRRFRSFLIGLFAEWIASKFFNAFFRGGSQQTGVAGGGGSAGGNPIMNAIQTMIFGGQGSGNGPGGTPYFNPNAAGIGGGGGGSLDGINIGSGGFDPRTGTYSNPTGRGGLSSGAAAGIAVGANIIGGAIGGTAGNIISLAGTGFGIGFSIGGPIGGAIGAGIGALAGVFMRIFGGDPKRKRDKNEKLPQLQSGFTDALAELRQLVADVRTLRVSPDSAIARATELRNSIASGFGIQFESNKYRKEAQSLIASRLKEADRLIADLRQAAEVANAASERERRIIPSFASGVMMSREFMRQYSDFKARNGMLAGVFTGRDSLPSMLAPGEMVLNPGQQSRVRSNAGMDPFVNAGIPGYANGRAGSDDPAEPARELVFVFEHSIDAEGMVSTTLKNSPAVGRELKIRIEDQFRNNELGLKKRGV